MLRRFAAESIVRSEILHFQVAMDTAVGVKLNHSDFGIVATKQAELL